MPFDPVTGLFTRVDNSFSEPVLGTQIDPSDADQLFDDYDAALNTAGITSAVPIITAAGAVTISATSPGALINKTVGEPTAVSIPSAATRNAAGSGGVGKPILIKDLKQDSRTNPIVITPVSGTIDGNATWTVDADGAWTVLYPLADNSGYWVGP